MVAGSVSRAKTSRPSVLGIGGYKEERTTANFQVNYIVINTNKSFNHKHCDISHAHTYTFQFTFVKLNDTDKPSLFNIATL